MKADLNTNSIQLLGKSTLHSSRLIYGCMRIAGDGSTEARQKGLKALQAAVDNGFNHFDHADIYGAGACEELFADFLNGNPGLREKLIVTSKCGIIGRDKPNPGDPGRYDFRKDHILKSVDGSLRRLRTDYLDLLLLHRPDYLMDAAEVADAFHILKEQGKVGWFGVSNFKPSQVSLLQSRLDFPLIVNQVEINIHNINALTDGTLDQCQQLNITPQAWCPLGGVAYPAWGNTFSKEDQQRIANELQRQAKAYDTEPWIVILAWLLKHPANIFPLIGSTTPERIKQSLQTLELEYSREDWYRLLEARNGHPVA